MYVCLDVVKGCSITYCYSSRYRAENAKINVPNDFCSCCVLRGGAEIGKLCTQIPKERVCQSVRTRTVIFLLLAVTAGKSMFLGNKAVLKLSYISFFFFCRLILKSVTNFQNLAPTNVVI